MRRHLLAWMLLGVAATMVAAGCGEKEGDDDDDNSAPPVVYDNVAVDELSWVVIPDSGGVETAATFGDGTLERHGFFIKFPAGFPGGAHSHTEGYRGVVIQGRIANTLESGGAVEWLGPGSYWAQPGVDRHVTACSAGTVCVGYIEFEGPFDVMF